MLRTKAYNKRRLSAGRSKLVFYAQSTSAVISGQLVERKGIYFDVTLTQWVAPIGRFHAIHLSDSAPVCLTDRYEFAVLAYDLGKPPLSATVTVTVRIMDENDNSPVFIFPNDVNNTVTVPHTLSPNTAVTSLEASDVDVGRNGELVFSRDGRNGTRFFDVKPTTGEVRFLHGLSDSQPSIRSFCYSFIRLASR